MQNIRQLSKEDEEALSRRFGKDFLDVMINSVVPIITDVQKYGDSSVREYNRKFDGIETGSIYAEKDEIEQGYSEIPSEVIEAFLKAKGNIEEFHNHQVRQNISYSRALDGSFGVQYQAIDAAAVYVPGGKAVYPSSVLMGVIPAQIAGVKDITIVTPPQKNGKIAAAVCAVCKLCGIEKVIKAGGAHGIAAAGVGTETVQKSDIIVGPGNIFVTAAKSYLFSLGIIQIDSMAGPSETLVIADDNANPKWVAYDLLSQAEHEENARAVLVVLSEKQAAAIENEIQNNLNEGKGRIEIKKTSVSRHFKIFHADSIDDAIIFSNKYGPEHLQLMVNDPIKYLEKIRNTGSVFLGYHSPVAAGDYFSGTNHVLPTGGAARFSSGLSVDTFVRRTSWQMLTPEGLRNAVGPVSIMADLEGFGDMHGGSVRVRFE